MNIFLNIIWFIFGGVMIAVEYVCSSLLMMLTIVGIPFGLQTMKLAVLALFPFGKQISVSPYSMGGCLNTIMNVLWWIVGGIPIAVTHLGWGLLFCITIIGIPFGIQHFKLMRLAFFPFGKEIVG
ncbi:MAG: YccF domain-containing protein [Muribaculaceae bacterium]|nr:YccF domain-containing protein [Muribaculaceae bacterium]